MVIYGVVLLEAHAKRHPTTRKTIATWIERVGGVSPKNFPELKRAFSGVDLLDGSQCCFDIGGNKARVIALVVFAAGTLTVEKVMTHEEYDRWNKTR